MRHNATCIELGYTHQTHDFNDLPAVIRAMYTGVTTWKTPKSMHTTLESDADKKGDSVGDVLSPWTYADDSMCMQSFVNYPALWISMKGSGIDTGRPSGIMRHNITCTDLGYTQETHVLEDLPAVVKALYVGVTTWKTPKSVSIALAKDESIGDVLSPWTYADEFLCLQTYVNYPALWVSMKGSNMRGVMRNDATCVELGYSRETHDLDDLPAVVEALYFEVTSWKSPKVVVV